LHLIAAALLIIWLLLFIQTAANLIFVPRLRADQTPQQRLFVSIVIPARNEARSIERTVRAFLAQDYSNFEVIVVNDRSSDGTGEILRSFNDSRLSIIDGTETPQGWLGKPWALEQGRVRARGELLLFVDADLMYAPEALRAAVAELEAQDVGLLALWPFLEMRTFAEQVAMPMMSFFGFCALPLWIANRSRSVWMGIGGGSGNLIRRTLLESIGGFAPLRDAVVDDVALARRARQAGARTAVCRADDLVSVRMYHGSREIVEGFTKNVFATFGRNYLWASANLMAMFVVHILPYALALTGDVLAISAVVLISVTRGVLFSTLRFRLDNAIFLHPFMVLFWAYIFVRSMWFTGVRNELHWRGRVYDAAATRFGAEQ